MAKVAIGVDIGGTNIRFGAVSNDGKIVAHKKLFTEASQGVDEVLAKLNNGIDDTIRKAAEKGYETVGTGIGIPGIIYAEKGIIHFSPNLPGWVDVNLKAAVKKQFKIPTYVENDANAYALGEAMYGAGKGVKSQICITLGTGVGGGIVLNGKIWRGADGMAGEVGHITVDAKGPSCGCGNNGCLERYSSATAVIERVAGRARGPKSSAIVELYRENPEAVTAEVVAQAAKAGDDTAAEIFREVGRSLGIVAAGLINLLNIEMIVIGGGLVGAWDLFIDNLRSEVRRRAFDVPAATCKIVPGKLGDFAGIYGAAGLALKKRK